MERKSHTRHRHRLGYVLAGLTAVGIIVIGVRFLIASSVAAAGFGIAAGQRP
jgi:hypothetical protein